MRAVVAFAATTFACNVLDGLTLPAEDSARDGGAADAGSDPVDPDGTCTSNASRCVGNAISACSVGAKPAMTTCPFGCVTDSGAHCASFVPASPVEASDAVAASTGDVVLAASATLDTGAGTITGVTGGFVFRTVDRSAPGFGGLAYKTAIFVFKNLTVRPGVVLSVRGPNGALLVGQQRITIEGLIEARGGCDLIVAGPGPGGFAAGTGPGKGGSGGGVGSTDSGGGGGAHGAAGGKGGPSGNGTVGEPGVPYGTSTLDPFVGGSGGASGFNGAGGGAGGGAIGLVAFGSIVFGTAPANVGINAGGCGGISGGNSGGGGGAGGAILVESPAITFPPTAILAANGGGGGAAGVTGPTRSHGTLSLVPTPGAGSGGGAGGGGAEIAGQDGTNPGPAGGGGGGSAGRIRIVTVAAPVLDGKTSPELGSAGASIGTIVTR